MKKNSDPFELTSKHLFWQSSWFGFKKIKQHVRRNILRKDCSRRQENSVDQIQTGTSTPGQNPPECYPNERVLSISQPPRLEHCYQTQFNTIPGVTLWVVYMHTQECTHVCVHPYMCACVCIYIRPRTCVCTHTHSHTHMHTYICNKMS